MSGLALVPCKTDLWTPFRRRQIPAV